MDSYKSSDPSSDYKITVITVITISDYKITVITVITRLLWILVILVITGLYKLQPQWTPNSLGFTQSIRI